MIVDIVEQPVSSHRMKHLHQMQFGDVFLLTTDKRPKQAVYMMEVSDAMRLPFHALFMVDTGELRFERITQHYFVRGKGTFLFASLDDMFDVSEMFSAYGLSMPAKLDFEAVLQSC